MVEFPFISVKKEVLDCSAGESPMEPSTISVQQKRVLTLGNVDGQCCLYESDGGSEWCYHRDCHYFIVTILMYR